ncbi:DUF2971 domain-containing protein [Achromobacter sp. UMC71]|uniref:DUF2971 domain-containing protein n=1 Tax=Achromobacter sp. UMC71 TaxID=1862320 RepID=UPI0015FF0FA8|nr:DUF2971 domain-containing protein [Achromobacter sp. UMC71]
MSNIYKYAGPDTLDLIVKDNGIATLKCSYPKDFNDPFELFLTIDYQTEPELLAYYEEIIGEIPQLPTTCFSRSPAVAPMWAHYANNLQGFAIQFDEPLLQEGLPDSGFGNVSYLSGPSKGLLDLLEKAYTLQKPRYIAWLQQGAFQAAYYTKADYWNYENERRMIVGESEVRSIGSVMLMDAPKGSVTALIAGPRASGELCRKLQEKADLFECEYFQMKIGRSSITPFFLDADGIAYQFNGQNLVLGRDLCDVCQEPVRVGMATCSWCRINKSHRDEAAGRNTFRIMENYGILDGYLESVRRMNSNK